MTDLTLKVLSESFFLQDKIVHCRSEKLGSSERLGRKRGNSERRATAIASRVSKTVLKCRHPPPLLEVITVARIREELLSLRFRSFVRSHQHELPSCYSFCQALRIRSSDPKQWKLIKIPIRIRIKPLNPELETVIVPILRFWTTCT